MSGARAFFSLPAINQPQGGFSHKAGQPVAMFSVPAQPRMLDTRALKLTGKLVIKDSDDVVIAADAVNDGASQGANITKATSTNIPQWCGVQGAVSKVVVQSKKSRQEISQVLNYQEFLSLRESYLRNTQDYRNRPQCRSLASGGNASSMSRRMTISSSGGKAFSVDISIPLLNNEALNLDEDHMGGLMISLYLQPDSNFLSSYFRLPGANQANADPTGASYSLQDLKLEGYYGIPGASGMPDMDEMMLQGRLSLMNDLVSSVDSSVFTPQAQMVEGFCNVYQTDTQENNYLAAASDFKLPVGTRAVTQEKDGIRYPQKYEVQVVPAYTSSVEGQSAVAGFDPSTLATKCHGMGDSEIRKLFERALFNGKEMPHISNTLGAESLSLDSQYAETAVAATDGAGKVLDQCELGIGADQTFGIVGAAQSYVNQDYQLRLQSGVNTGNAKLPTDFSQTSLIQRAFVRNIEILDTRSLVKTI